MSATIQILRWTGSGPTKTQIDGLTTRASASDSASPGSANPVPVPAVGTNYSYWVVTRLTCTVAPATLVNNLKWYSDGTNSLGTGVGLKAQTATAYTQATGTLGTSGNLLNTSNYPSLAGATFDAFTKTSGSPLSVTGSTAITGDFGDFVVMQFEVATTAGAGVTPTETITWVYDES